MIVRRHPLLIKIYQMLLKLNYDCHGIYHQFEFVADLWMFSKKDSSNIFDQSLQTRHWQTLQNLCHQTWFKVFHFIVQN